MSEEKPVKELDQSQNVVDTTSETPEEKEQKLKLSKAAELFLGAKGKDPEKKQEEFKVPREPHMQPETPSADNLFFSTNRLKCDIEVSEEDKEVYLRSMLNDEPFDLVIDLFADKIHLGFQIRSSFEQDLIIKVAQKIISEQPENERSVLNNNLLLQRLCLSITLKTINDEPYKGSVSLNKDMDGEAARNELEVGIKYIKEDLNEARWGMLLQGMIIFHEKQAIMQGQCLNKDFWVPAD